MSESEKNIVGLAGWRDLTVPNAGEVSKFYEKVIGWKASPVEMEGYSDFAMLSPTTGDAMAGVCHARGTNADLPPQWLIYFTVENVEASAAQCREQGGEVLVPPRELGDGRFAVIKDPAGAVCAVYQPEA